MSTSPSVAVVILNWNGRKFLEQFLPSVMASLYDNKRIIVADNGSTDDSVSFVRTHYPQVELLLNNTNEGFAKGYNTALKQVQSDYYVLLNSDVEVTPNWIGPVITVMENDAAIAACQPKVLAWNKKNEFEYAGASGGWIDRYGYPFMRGRVFDVCEEDKGQYDTPQYCFWASGAALFVKAAAYHAVGGLDEYFFAHQEEIDLCWRMQLAGYQVMVQPQSVVYHVGGGTLQKTNPRKTLLNFRNNLIMLFKNYRAGERLLKLPVRIALDAVAAWRGLLGGDVKYFMAIGKAHIQFMEWILVHQKESVFPAQQKRAPLQGYYHGSIIWQYFVKKKSRFSEIVDNK
ncbi:MAG: glycosyltransferase family 2 protein [Bacteroidetes bacterium]|nr:glycosyltransferase family 2 protein [Bacteroidota bacterium]